MHRSEITGSITMKRLQFLKASKNPILEHRPSSTLIYLSKITQQRDRQIPINIDELSNKQLVELRQQTYQKLCYERRRCGARAIDYDVNNHIRLYLIHKQLAVFTKQSGPQKEPQI
jgi:hypothetical protein